MFASAGLENELKSENDGDEGPAASRERGRGVYGGGLCACRAYEFVRRRSIRGCFEDSEVDGYLMTTRESSQHCGLPGAVDRQQAHIPGAGG